MAPAHPHATGPKLDKMRSRIPAVLLAVFGFAGVVFACEYQEKKSPCCDTGVALDDDVYLFTYYAWAGVYYYHTGIKAHGVYYFYNSGDKISRMRRQSVRSLVPWKVGIVTPRSSCRNDPNNGNYKFWKKTFIGKTTKTKQEYADIIKEMQADSYWQRYHVLKRNCNHFTRELATRLGLREAYDSRVPFKFPGFSIAK